MIRTKIKFFIVTLWVVIIFLSLFVYFFDRNLIESNFLNILGSSTTLGYILYLVISAMRGFTLIPITYFIVVGIILFPPIPLYIMTMIGVIVSSLCVYYFSEYLNFDKYFEKKHPKKIKKIKNILIKKELPIVITWSFMPFLPTDLICYVCGTLEIDVRKFLLGVVVGEGISCAIYIFLGKEILNYLHF